MRSYRTWIIFALSVNIKSRFVQAEAFYPEACLDQCRELEASETSCLDSNDTIMMDIANSQAAAEDWAAPQVPLMKCFCPDMLANEACAACMTTQGVEKWAEARVLCQQGDYRNAAVAYFNALDPYPEEEALQNENPPSGNPNSSADVKLSVAGFRSLVSLTLCLFILFS